jgi:transposase
MNQDKVYLLPITTLGGAKMVKRDMWHEIHSRFKRSESKKSIARTLDLDVRTVRKILSQSEPKRYQRQTSGDTLLTGYQDYIKKRLEAVGYCAQSIYEELKERGYNGGYDTVRRFIQPFRKEAFTEPTPRYETPPGKQGQADWGQCWTILGSKRSKVHVFVMTLGYSRKLFAIAAHDEKLPAFLKSHMQAFDHFGGVPHEILYDNAKTVVLSRNTDGSRIQWNHVFWDFSRYYGYRAWAHRPYWPQTKGKVESSIKYVKRFLRGKVFDSIEHLNNSLMIWTTTTADQRIHGTTHRRPADMFEEEKDLLIDHTGKPPYVLQVQLIRYVAKDCMINFETNRYSVPFSYVGKSVELQTEPELIRIYHEGQLIAVHPRSLEKHQVRMQSAHYQGLLRRYKFDRSTSSDEVQVRDLDFYESLVERGAV